MLGEDGKIVGCFEIWVLNLTSFKGIAEHELADKIQRSPDKIIEDGHQPQRRSPESNGGTFNPCS
jgi:hypothetical protein